MKTINNACEHIVMCELFVVLRNKKVYDLKKYEYNHKVK